MNLKEDILIRSGGGLNVFLAFCPPHVNMKKKKFHNPFYEDHEPSCNLYLSNVSHQWVFHDFGDSRYHGDCFWFVAMLCGLDVQKDFRKVLKIICDKMDYGFLIRNTEMQKQIGESNECEESKRRKSCMNKKKEIKKYTMETIPWSQSNLWYWERFGITQDVLNRYNVRHIDHYVSISASSEFSVSGSSKSPIYGYEFEKFVKIYRPLEPERSNRFRSIGNFPEHYCFGWSQLPPFGDIVFITGGEKDVMSLASRGFNAICFQSETASIPEKTISLLNQRFKHIILLYDCDETGLRQMEKGVDMLSKYKVLSLVLPLSGSKQDKDVSDYFACGKTREDFRALYKEMLSNVNADSALLVESCKIDLGLPVKPSPVIISADGVPLGSASTIMCVTGLVGTGKSQFVSAIIAGALVTDDRKIDTLGLTIAPNYNHRAVLHFDTEQTKTQLGMNDMTALRRAGLRTKPAFFESLYLAPNTIEERLTAIDYALDQYNLMYDGIHLVVIDGAADLLYSPNDEGASMETVLCLTRFAGYYDTCIVCVVHTLPTQQKLRGHLGSEFMRKSSAIVSIERDEDEQLSYMRTWKVRDGNPFAVPMYAFGWDEQLNMFVSRGVKSPSTTKATKREELLSLSRQIFEVRKLWDYESLWQEIAKIAGLGERASKGCIAKMKQLCIIDQDEKKRYKLVN